MKEDLMKGPLGHYGLTDEGSAFCRAATAFKKIIGFKKIIRKERARNYRTKNFVGQKIIGEG